MFDIFIMDMGGHDQNVSTLQTRFPHARVVRYYDNHLDTVKRCITHCRTPYAWVISSCCDYTAFDFDYKSAPWESYQIHCWASGTQKFGDTFLINVAEFLKQSDIKLLEWYKDINWHETGVPRLPWPVNSYYIDDLVGTVKASSITTPYMWFRRDGNGLVDFDPPLWRDRAVHTFNRANSVSLVPREISASLSTQIYDYPYIIKQKDLFLDRKPLDIIYISNGEQDADRWLEHLINTCGRPVKHVKGVNGRANAYKAAAEVSETDWFFTVFAKLEVNPTFDWSWQPDYLQGPKHYIFNSQNPVNGLEYGHMGVIAYNKKLVLDTWDWGLDFTLSRPHAVVPLLSGTAHYNTTPEATWRTAFREVLKLRADVAATGSVESQYRLDTWLDVAQGDNAMWSLLGAKDAIEYYVTSQGKHEFLMLSFEWKWLQDYYNKIYNPNARFDANKWTDESFPQPVQPQYPITPDILADLNKS